MRGVLMALRYTDHCGKLEESERKTTTAATAFLNSGSSCISNSEWKDKSSGDLKDDAATTDENEVLFFYVTDLTLILFALRLL